MSALSFIVAWANLPFTVVGGIAVLFSALASFGLFESEHDGVDFGDQAGAAFGAFLGAGRLPLSLTLLVFGLAFALTGLALNTPYLPSAPSLVSLCWSLPIATAVGALGVAGASRLLAPLFATEKFEATRRADLVGLSAVVISSQITDTFGEVRVKDRLGHDVRLVCKLSPGYEPPSQGDSVVLLEVDDVGAVIVAPDRALSA